MTLLDQSPGSDTGAIPVVSSALQTLPEQLRTRLERAKHSFTTRDIGAHLRRADHLDLITEGHAPQPGEVVLARVTSIGQHKRLESPVSRRQNLFLGDEILVAYGSRYAADQYLAILPEDLGPCHLAAAGGLASRVVEQHAEIGGATTIEPIGVLRDAQGPLTLARASTHRVRAGVAERQDRPGHRTPVFAVLGTSMNSGKSTVLAQFAHGLVASGLRVAAGKATGTGAGNDYNLFLDAGAQRVLDFTDFGYSSTFRTEFGEVRDLVLSMADELASGAEQPDVVLIEIADGIYQGETSRLLTDEAISQVVDRVVLAAGDALGAAGGVAALRALGRTTSVVTGVLTASPIAIAEAHHALELPVVPTFDLCQAETATELVSGLLHGRDELAG